MLYTIVYTKNASSATVVDGFVIMGGSATGSASQNPLHHKGAGWYNDATNGTSSPSIRNCIFMDNIAREGAGIYNYASNGNCEPSSRTANLSAIFLTSTAAQYSTMATTANAALISSTAF